MGKGKGKGGCGLLEVLIHCSFETPCLVAPRMTLLPASRQGRTELVSDSRYSHPHQLRPADRVHITTKCPLPERAASHSRHATASESLVDLVPRSELNVKLVPEPA